MTSHYLNQCWPDSLTHIYAAQGGDELNYVHTSRGRQTCWELDGKLASTEIIRCVHIVQPAKEQRWSGSKRQNGSNIRSTRNGSITQFSVSASKLGMSKFAHLCSTITSHICINVNVALTCLTHLPIVSHICVSKLGQHLMQIMACRLLGIKPLSEPVLCHCQQDP